MYINDRDQINYHGFLRALREMHQVSQKCVSKGICTVSGMNRFENGNRVAEKLMRDRLTARLGISGETYEDYLLPKEYVLWEHRMRIIKAIEKCDFKRAKCELADYEMMKGLNRINLQFVEAMRFMLLMLENASEEELSCCVQKAVKCTVSNVKKALDGEHLLADQEINLIAEQMRLCPPKKVVRNINEWRITEYEKLIAYMDNSHWEDLQKAKVYPKVTYYICKCLLEKETTEAELRRGLELCYTAIELLRDTSRLYYFIELTESRRELATRLMEYPLDNDERIKLQEMLEENNSWERVFKDLYAEYKVKTYMTDFCYLYYETECHNMVEVIETRRNMLGLSRVKLGEGICSDKTIIRFEREGRNPTVELVRRLFEKMGLCAEYRRAQIITTNVEALHMYYNKLVKLANDGDYERGIVCINELKERIETRIPYNEQEIMRVENNLLYNCRKIDLNEFANNIIKALKCTVNLSALDAIGLKYLTVAEMVCIHDLAFDLDTEYSEKCLNIIEAICIEVMKNEMDVGRISLLELLMGRFASKLGDGRRYKESCDMSDRITKECLIHYRTEYLSNALYNRIWNHQQQNHNDDVVIIGNLEKCVILSQIIKKYNAAAFFQRKLEYYLF